MIHMTLMCENTELDIGAVEAHRGLVGDAQ